MACATDVLATKRRPRACVTKLLALLLALPTPARAGILDTVTDAGGTSTAAAFYTGPGAVNPFAMSTRAGNSDFHFDAPFHVGEAFSLNLSTFTNGGSLTPTLLSDGTSRHDPNTVSCGSATECLAVTAGKYVPDSRGGILMTSDGGLTWRVVGFCLSAQSDAFALTGAVWHSGAGSSAILSVFGKAALCVSNDGGATWRTQAVYPLGTNAFANGDVGYVHAFRTLVSGLISFRWITVTPSAGGEIRFYNNTINPATGALGTGALVSTPSTSGTNEYTYTWWLVFPGDGAFGFTFIGGGYSTYVTTDTGATWSNTGLSASSNYWLRPSCPQGASGSCYIVAPSCASRGGSITIRKAGSPFTSWSSITVATPTVPSDVYGSSWSCGDFDGFKGMECARFNNKDACVMTITMLNNAFTHILYTSDGWASGSITATPVTPILGPHAHAWVNWPSAIDTGAGTSVTHFLIAGARSNFVKVSLDGTVITRIHPAVPRTQVAASGIVDFSDGAGLYIGGGLLASSASGGVLNATSAAPTSLVNLWTSQTAGLSTYTRGTISAVGALTVSTFLLALANANYDTPNNNFIWASKDVAVYATTDGGATFAKVCNPYTPANGYFDTAIRSIKVDFVRPYTNGATPAPANVFIVHPQRVYLWDGTITGSSCGTLLVSQETPSLANAASVPVRYNMSAAMACSPDALAGCFMLQLELESQGSLIYTSENPLNRVVILNNNGTALTTSGTFTKVMHSSFIDSANYDYLIAPSSDIIFGSDLAAFAWVTSYMGWAATSFDGGASWNRLDLTASPLSLAAESIVVSAAFGDATTAYLFVGEYYTAVTQAPIIVRAVFGASSVTLTKMSMVGSNELPARGELLGAYAMTMRPRFFPTEKLNGPLPSSSSTPTPSPTPSETPSTTPTSTPSNSPSPSITGSPSTTPTSTPSDSPSPSITGSPSTTPTSTPSNSPSPSITGSPSAIPTSTPSNSPSPTSSETGSTTPTPSEIPTPSGMPSPTPSPSTSPAAGAPASLTPSPSPTGTPAAVGASTSSTPTLAPTPSNTPSSGSSASSTPAPVPAVTPSSTATPTPSTTPSVARAALNSTAGIGIVTVDSTAEVLPPGGVAGVVIALLLAACCFCFALRRRKRKEEQGKKVKTVKDVNADKGEEAVPVATAAASESVIEASSSAPPEGEAANFTLANPMLRTAPKQNISVRTHTVVVAISAPAPVETATNVRFSAAPVQTSAAPPPPSAPLS